MLDQWVSELESEDHRSRRDMTEKSIARHIKAETERQVTSSTTPGAVFVSDCVAIMAASIAQPSYLCCGLSNGSVCLLNTANLSKIYLFEADRDSRAALRDSERKGPSTQGSGPGSPPQLVSVAAHVVAASVGSTSAQLLLCMTLDGVVCVCPMDMSTVLERKKVSRSDLAKVKPFPSTRSSSVVYSCVQFSPTGRSIAAVLGMADEGATTAPSSGTRFSVAVLSTTDAAVSLQSRYACEKEWHVLVPPRALPLTEATAVELCWCGWWSADLLACVWSNSSLQLYHAADMTLVGETRLLRHCAADAVTKATLSQPSTAADAADGVSTNIVALVLEHNVAATFYVTAKRAAARDAPDLKRPRAEATVSLSATPTFQTYCTEEIPVREVHLIRAFAWTLVLLLESGAVLFVDVETMRLSVHRAVNRLRAPDADRYRQRPSLALPRHFFCVVNGKPFTAAIVEHNAAVLLRAQ